MKGFWQVVVKDLRTEFRKPEALVSMVFFGFLLLVVLNMSLTIGREVTPEGGAGILWVAVTFSSVLGLGKVFSVEKRNNCLDGLLTSPLGPESLFAAKMAVNYALILLSEIAIVPLFFILYGDTFALDLPMLVLVVMLANLGFSATGTLFSAITADTRRNEALLPILFYPVVTPLVSISVKVTGAIFSGAGTGEYSSWLYVMAGYGSVFTGLGYLLMSHVVME